MLNNFTSTQQKRKICAKKISTFEQLLQKKMETKYHLPHTKANDINFQKFANITS